MRVPVTELDLELDPAEERRRRMEDQAVHTGRQAGPELGDPAVVVRPSLADELIALVQLDRDALGGPPAFGVEHVG